MTENPIDVPQSSLELVIAYAGNSIEVQREEEVYSLLSTVSSSAGRGIMCDKILEPDTLNVDMGDFV